MLEAKTRDTEESLAETERERERLCVRQKGGLVKLDASKSSRVSELGAEPTDGFARNFLLWPPALFTLLLLTQALPLKEAPRLLCFLALRRHERERDSLAPVHLASVGQRLARKSKKKANETKELSRLSTCDR